jgi:hypothetical protein
VEYPNGFEVKPIPQTKKDRVVIAPSLVGRLFEQKAEATGDVYDIDESVMYPQKITFNMNPSLIGRLFERNQPTMVNGMTKDEFFKEFMDPEVT